MRKTRTTRLVREGQYVAEVDVDLLEENHEWAPYLSMDDCRKLDEVREALRRSDLKVAIALGGRIYELRPVAAE